MACTTCSRYASILGFLLFILGSTTSALGAPLLHIEVEVIKADRRSETVEPHMKELTREISPVLNYTGFSLIRKSSHSLRLQQTASIPMSRGQKAEVTFVQFDEDKARLLVRILERKKETFRTTLLMLDKGSAFIGGPPYEDGVLLLRIRSTFSPQNPGE